MLFIALLLIVTRAEAGNYKVGILIAESSWTDTANITDDVVTSGSVTTSFSVHRFTQTTGITQTVCELLDDGYSGFISFVDCPSAQMLDWQLHARHVPNIVLSRHVCKQEFSRYTYQFFQSCSSLNNAIHDVIEYLGSISVGILHDNVLSSRCLTDLIIQLSTIPVSSRVINVQGGNRLDLAKKYNIKVFIVIVSSNIIDAILMEAESLGLLLSEHSWIISGDTTSLSPVIQPGVESARIAYFRPLYNNMAGNGTCTKSWPTNQGTAEEAFITDCKEVFMSALTSYEGSYGIGTGTVTCSNTQSVLSYGETLASIIQQSYIIGNTKLISWTSNSFPEDSAYQICSTEKSSSEYKYMGVWDSDNNLQLIKHLFGNDFTDFGNITLTIATKPIKPFIIFTDNNGTIEYTGFCFDILNELARQFKFNYKIVTPPDGMYGGLNADGTWNGMVGMVMRGDADMAIGPFTITSIRESVIDFTIPYIEDGVGILTKRPDQEKNKIFKMFKPFSLTVWFAIGVAVSVVGVLLCLIGYVNPYTRKAFRKDPTNHYHQRSLKETSWLIYGSFLEQGIDPRPTTFSGRSMLGFWWVFTILMTSTYTANLAAVLTVSIPEQPINSLDELVSQNEIFPLVKSGTNIHTLFMTSTSGIYKQVWDMMYDMPVVTSNAEALNIVRLGQHALMTDVTQLEYIVRQECETYSLADEIFNNAGLGFVLPENAIFKDAFNLNLMKMQEAGMTERWKEKWWPTIESCSLNTRSSGAKPLGMDSLAGLFYVYIAIAGLSVIIFVISMVYTKILQKKVHPYLLQLKAMIRRDNAVKTAL